MDRHIMIAVMFLFSVVCANVPAHAVEGAEYVGHSQCKICHNKKEEGEIWNIWSTKKHAKAYAMLGSPEAKEIGEKWGLSKSPQESPECLRCHVTAYNSENDPPVPAKIAMKDGVQCEMCHGPASLHVKMKKDTTVDMSAHITRPDESTCRKCHNEESPTWDPERYTSEDGTKSGFDFKQAWKKIEHVIPGKEKK